MKIEKLTELEIPEKFVQKFKDEKITKLYPPQEEALKHGLLDGKNMVLSVPTAAGKTMVATLGMINKFSKPFTKAVYMAPLVALAREKYDYYKKFFDGKYKVALSVGDYDSADSWLTDYDLIICTTEKLDSLIRHGAQWIASIGLIIVDEVHMLNDGSRGPTLEIVMTRLRDLLPDAQIIALSATINNAEDIAHWIGAETVKSDFRPVKLHEGLSYESRIKFFDKKDYELAPGETENSIIDNTLSLKKQALFFVSTRKNAESLAERLSKTVQKRLNKNEFGDLSKLSDQILNVLEQPTRQCKKIAACVKYGSAFHHAGLLSRQKTLIEDAFRDGLIKVISATPTLAMGVNLPAFRVVIRDSKRYYGGIGSAHIPVLEYKQFVGRAGRPQFDTFGESILVARTEREADELAERYIFGEPEEIYSKLAVEPVLRMHTLSLIASGFVSTEGGLIEFFSKTFYAHQYGSMGPIEDKLYEILDLLEEWKFITKKNGLKATRIGKRVSELYIDPLTAHEFMNSIKFAKTRRLKPFSVLHTISDTLEMRPLLRAYSSDVIELNEVVARNQTSFLKQVPDQWELEYEKFVHSVKTAMLFEAWINERTDDEILSRFRVAPGEMRGKLRIADWLVYTIQELALLMAEKEIMKVVRRVRSRLTYGVREELLPLVRLKQIGRVRARRLWKANLKTLKDLRTIPDSSLAKIIGPVIAASIKQQLGEKTTLKPKGSTRQSTLG